MQTHVSIMKDGTYVGTMRYCSKPVWPVFYFLLFLGYTKSMLKSHEQITEPPFNMSDATHIDPWKKLVSHDEHEVQVNGIPILVCDNVFTPDPNITYSTSQLLQALPSVKDKTVLDMGCGTGLLGIHCLKNGAKEVVFADISSDALENTKKNLAINNVNIGATIIHSDLFEHIPQTFDIICANLPILDAVWHMENSAEHIALRFLRDCKEHMRPSGKAFLAWASFADISHLEKKLKELRYTYTLHEEKKMNYTWQLIEICF